MNRSLELRSEGKDEKKRSKCLAEENKVVKKSDGKEDTKILKQSETRKEKSKFRRCYDKIYNKVTVCLFFH